MERGEKVRENRARRAAERQALILRRSRRRDGRAADFGMYWLLDSHLGTTEVGGEWGTTLDAIEDALNEGGRS